MRRLALLLALLPTGTAHAADPAAIDSRYGRGGVAEIPFSRDLAALPGGGLVGAGGKDGFGVARLDARGRLTDRTTVPLGTGAYAEAITGQPDGKLVVAGRVNRALAVARLRSDLTLDPSFGEQGVTVLAGSDLSAADVAVLADGHVAVLTNRFTIAALTPDGRPAAARSSDPLPQLRKPDAGATGTELRPLPDGRLLALGQSSFESGDKWTESDPLLVRLGADGAPDPSFADGGVATGNTILGTGLSVQRSGRIVVSGYTCGFYSDSDEEDCRPSLDGFTPDGAGDTSFGRGGRLIVPRITGDALSVAVLGGDALLVGTDRGTVRLHADGRTDLRYGGCGAAEFRGKVERVFPLDGGSALLADGAKTKPGRVRRIRGGTGSAPRDMRPPFAPLFAGSSYEPLGRLSAGTLRLPAYLPVDGRVSARLRIAGIGDELEHVPLTRRMLRRLGLPRTIGAGAAHVRACRGAAGVRMRIDDRARRRMKGRRFLVHLDVTVRNRGGVARARQKLNVSPAGVLSSGF